MNKWIMPKYYNDFKCKIGMCRNVCCKGWTVSVNLQEYYKVINLECDNEFREKLDRAFYVNLRPTTEKYAVLRKNYYGDCIFHGEDGYCEIQKNFGINSIPSVCDLYPRNINTELALEKSCSNSCEKVLEMLFEDSNKFQICEEETANTPICLNNQYISVRKLIIDILSNRDKSIYERVKEVSERIPNAFDFRKGDYKKLALEYLELYREKSSVAFDYLQEIEEVFNEKKDHFNDLEKHLYEILPDTEIYLEKYLVNHIFFTGFPFDKLKGILREGLYSLMGVYELTKYIAIIAMKNKNELSDFVDAIAKLYRLIGHSDFHKYIGKYIAQKIEEE